MDIIKNGTIKVSTQPKDYDLQATGLVFKSYDNQIALAFDIKKQDGTPADLLGATLRLLMYVYDEVDGTVTKEPIPFITKNLITESFLNGHVKYILPEALKAYNGMVEAYVYIEYPDGSTSDNLGFTFRMKRSAIDGLAQDKADYFIEDFKQLLATASLEANKVIEGLDTEIKNLQQATKDANTAVDGAMDRIDGLEAEIGQLERLREMYIDTLDFGDYDYSGNLNLMNNLSFSDFAVQAGGGNISDGGNFLKINKTSDANLFVMAGYKNSAYYLAPVLSNTTYTITYVLRKSSNFVPQSGKRIILRYRLNQNNVTNNLGELILDSTNITTEFTTYTKTFATGELVNPNSYYFQVFVEEGLVGEIELSYEIKLERGSTATPYQPNLLAEPYNMCREYPNENMVINNDPVTSNAYLVKSYQIKPLAKGKKYTLTLKGTKPSTQTWRPFFTQDNGSPWSVGDMTPVPGLPNTWVKTFTASANSHPTGPAVQIYQAPSTSVGQCKIDWCKLEEGEVSTPINVPTYKGLGILDTNDPTKYVWNYTELVDVDGIQDALENVEQRTTTLEGKANTIDGRLNNVNTALNTVQSTADQILAEVTAADVMKETDLPSYLANKPIVAGGMADFASKVTSKKHPCPHNLAITAKPLDHADMVPNALFKYEPSQTHYDNIGKLDDKTQALSTATANEVAVLGMKFDLISQIAKDYPTFFDDCATTAEKVKKIQTYIEGATLTIYGQGISSNIEVSAAIGNTWSANVTFQQGTQQYEMVYDQLKQNLFTRSRVQNDGSMIFRACSKTLATESLVGLRVDYVRLDYTLNLSSDNFITPIERDVTKDNLTQILSDDSTTIKGVMDFKFKDRGSNANCPHATYYKGNTPQATNMSEITYEADADTYSKIQNKGDGLAIPLVTDGATGNVVQTKFKFDLVTAIEKEHPHLFKGLTTTKQKVDVLKAKIQELKFNVWARGEGTNGNIQIGSSLSNVDAIDARQTKDIGETTEFARAEFYSDNNDACARRINDDGTVLYWLCGSAVSDSLPQPKVIIDYVNLEYTLSDKPSDYVVKQDDSTYAELKSDVAVLKTNMVTEKLEKGNGKSGVDSTKVNSVSEVVWEFHRVGKRVFFTGRVNMTQGVDSGNTMFKIVDLPTEFAPSVGEDLGVIALSCEQWTAPRGNQAAVLVATGDKPGIYFNTGRTGNHYISGSWRTK